MNRYASRFLLAAATFLAFSLGLSNSGAQAQGPLPSNDYERGLVYDSLQVPASEICRGGYQMPLTSTFPSRVLCTHGPDPAPVNFDIHTTVAPVRPDRLAAPTAVTCDGDGVSGNRVQLIYAHASDVADRYSAYLASFQQWAVEMDLSYLKSAQETGGTRHIRFVTDGSCNSIITDLSLSPGGDDNAVNTFNELAAQGYNRTDRKYLVFADAHVYCGISSVAFDDQPGPRNANNFGNSFGRIDAGCWSAVIAAHELMHQLGAVQFSAPHSDGNWHCTDGYDNMCDHGASPLLSFTACPDPAGDSLMDCDHDDYFSTNRLANPYLSNHWNAAINIFLISPRGTRVNSIVTGRLKSGIFTAADTFKAPYNVTARIHVVDQYDYNLAGVKVVFRVNRPNGGAICKLTALTNRSGTAQGTCVISVTRPPPAAWDVHVDSLTLPSYSFDSTNSVRDHVFTLR